MICTPLQIFLSGQIKEDRMGGACGIWGRNKMHTRFWWVNMKEPEGACDMIPFETFKELHTLPCTVNCSTAEDQDTSDFMAPI